MQDLSYQRHRPNYPPTAVVLLAIGLWSCTAPPARGQVSIRDLSTTPDVLSSATAYQIAWQSYQAAVTTEQAHSPACVDHYYRCACAAWNAMVAVPETARANPEYSNAWSLYHWCLVRLVQTGQFYQRLDPRRGLSLGAAESPNHVITTYRGFPWNPDEFHVLIPVGDYSIKNVTRVFRRPGMGIPLLVICQQPRHAKFTGDRQVFAANLLLKPKHGTHFVDFSGADSLLELSDPIRTSSSQCDGIPVPLACDLSAPLVYGSERVQRTWLEGLVRPADTQVKAKLLMLEPYQPGKIPVVFIHGLMSDPLTWADTVNALRTQSGWIEDFQIWAFRYPTGEPFLASAASLRDACREIVDTLDPAGQDPALRQMVLIGHSMGGLVSKLQVTYSGNTLWQCFANRPLEGINTTPEYRSELQRVFFFEPQPMVRRVVFIGTPHGGSSWATRSIGRLGSAFVEQSSAESQMHQTLIQQNPNVFSPAVMRRFPSSIDLLEPESPALTGMRQIAVAPNVSLHSIIGTVGTTLSGEPTDGIVPLSSARHPCVQSEKLVAAHHSGLQSHPETIQEIMRILQLHLRQAALPATAR